MKGLWVMLKKDVSAIHKGNWCAMIIWHLRRSFNRGLCEGLLLKMKTENAFIENVFVVLSNQFHIRRRHTLLPANSLGSRLKSIYAS